MPGDRHAAPEGTKTPRRYCSVRTGTLNRELRIRVVLKSSRREVSVAVIDNGPGIPAHRRDQVFDKFYRAEEVANGQGSGLGLYICRSIIEAHRGRIWIDARYKNGTRISFAFRRIPTPESAPARPATTSQEVRP